MGTDVPTSDRAYAQALRAADQRQQARVLALLAVLVLLGGLAFSNTSDALPPGVFAQVVRGEVVLDSGRVLQPGDLIEEQVPFGVPDGEAQLRGNFGDVFLRADAHATGYPRTLVLDEGEALIDSSDIYLGVNTPELFASGTGLWRVDVTLNPRVAFYEGSGAASPAVAGGEVLGVAVPLQPFQEARASDGIPTGPFPVVYSAQDTWDRRNLAGLMAVDDEADSLAATVEARWGTDPRPVSFYERFEVMDEALLDALEQFATTSDGDTYGVPGDILTAVFATRALIDGAAREPLTAIELVDDRRADGATWGVVLAMDGVGLAEFQAARDLGLRAEEQLPPLPPPTPSPTPSPLPSPSPSPSPSPTPTETDDPDPQPSECPDGQERNADGDCVDVCPEGQERTPEGDCEDPREPADCVTEPDAAECTVTNVIEEVLDVLPLLDPGPPDDDDSLVRPPLGLGSDRAHLPARAAEAGVEDPPGRSPVLRLLLSVIWL